MTLKEFLQKLKHLSTTLIIVDPDGHEVWSRSYGEFVHWVYKMDYEPMEIDYITPEDGNTFIIYLEG